jgi:hypothetical protein
MRGLTLMVVEENHKFETFKAVSATQLAVKVVGLGVLKNCIVVIFFSVAVSLPLTLIPQPAIETQTQWQPVSNVDVPEEQIRPPAIETQTQQETDSDIGVTGEQIVQAVSKSLQPPPKNPLPAPPVVVAAQVNAPILSNISVGSLTTDSATITWTTDKPATSIVDYGATAAYGFSVTNSSLAVSHSLTVAGLSPSSDNHFRVRSADGLGNIATSSDGTFRTLIHAPTGLRVISQ